MREDRLRALRAIRFASRFEFSIEPATLGAIRGSAPHLRRLSHERVQQELVKTMQQVHRAGGALRIWRDVGALEVLVPALATVSDMALATLDLLPRDGEGGRTTPQRTSNRVTALFLDVQPAMVRRALSELRFSKHETNWATSIVERWDSRGAKMAAGLVDGRPDDVQVRRWLASLGRLYSGAFVRIACARWSVMRSAGLVAPTEVAVRSLHRRMRGSLFRDPIELADLAIGGDDLRGAGIPAGPIYAKILHALLDLVLADPSRNTPDALLAAVPAIVASLGARGTSTDHHSTEH
jgi:tRNA nucleotidyltransferase (CCA-adding enzyme)